jgi:hypothetical protein
MLFGGNNKKMTGKMMIRFLRITVSGLACLLSVASGTAPSSAADYPNRPVYCCYTLTATSAGTSSL